MVVVSDTVAVINEREGAVALNQISFTYAIPTTLEAMRGFPLTNKIVVTP